MVKILAFKLLTSKKYEKKGFQAQTLTKNCITAKNLVKVRIKKLKAPDL